LIKLENQEISFYITFWKNVESYLSFKTYSTITIEGKQIITYFDCREREVCVMAFVLKAMF